jgi:hypothetical protein
MTAMVVQRVVLFNADYEHLRRVLDGSAAPSCVAVLGPGGFQDISGEKVNTVLLALDRNRRHRGEGARSLFLDLEASADKDRELQLLCNDPSLTDSRIFRVVMERFGAIPGAPWAYSLPGAILARFDTTPLLSSIASCRSGLSTGDDLRFLRYAWEIIETGARWRPIVDGGGGTERWWRAPNLLVDGEHDFVRLRCNVNSAGRPRSALRNLEFQGRPGITYLKNAGKTFAGRLLPEGTMFLDTGRSIFPPSEKMLILLGLLNTAHISDLMCRIGGGGSFVNADIERVPVPMQALEAINIGALVTQAVSLRRELVTLDIVPDGGAAETGGLLRQYLSRVRERRGALAADLLDVENRIETAVRQAYGEGADRIAARALGNEPLSSIEELVDDLADSYVLTLLGVRPARGDSRPVRDEDGIIPIVGGTGEEALLQRVRRQIAEDFGAANVNAVERDFQQLCGKSLGEWLASDFFKRHISRFMKRPVAWQFESALAATGSRRRGRATGRKQPAFSCLVAYKRLDRDLIPKLRSQYIGPLRTRLETELAGSELLRERTADQDARRLELKGKLEELKAFDARLERVLALGFASPTLDEIAANEPLDKWTSRGGRARAPETREAFLAQERRYDPDLSDGVRVNVSPLQRAGVLAADVLPAKDIEEAIAARAQWRADERRWCREGKLPRPGWWTEVAT